MKIAGRILTLLFAVILFGMAIANAPLTLSALEAGRAREQGLAGVSSTVHDAYLTDEFWQKNQFVNVNGLHARLSGRRELNDVVLMRNGMLGYSGNASRSMSLQAAGISYFAQWLNAVGTDFLYVQMPCKMDLQGDMLPLGHEDYLHANTTALVDALALQQVPVVDLREEICASVEQVERYFYPTDHHWSAKGAMKGFEMVLDKLQEMYPGQPILAAEGADPAAWEEHTLRNYFLGSQGKRVGQWYAGVDDLVWYTPDFDTSMSMYIKKYRTFTSGTFRDAVMQMHYVEEAPDYFNLSPYNVYVGGDYPLVTHRNPLAPVDMKVLIIKDSFTLPLQSYMSTVFTSVDVIDPRHYTETSVAEYVRRYEPDVVLLAVNPSGLSLPEYYSFETPDENEYYALTEVFAAPVEVAAKEGGYNYAAVPVTLEPDTLYRVDASGIGITQGSSDGVSMALYNRSRKEFLDSWVFDVDHLERTGDGVWYFRTDASADCQLLIYAGVQGSTDGVGVACDSVRISRAEAAYPDGYAPRFRTLVPAADVTLTPADDAYHYQALSASLEPDAEYTLTAQGVTLDAGVTDGVLLALYDSGARVRVATQTVTPDQAGGVSWVFRTPAEHEGDLKLLLYAGMPGKTDGVGVTFRGLSLVKNLIPADEAAQAEASAAPAAVQNGAAAAPNAAAPAGLPLNETVTLEPSDSDYLYASIPLSLEPGAAYALTMDALTLTAGEAQAVDATLYDPARQTHLLTLELSPTGRVRRVFRAPEGAQDCRLLIYAGKRGGTAGVGLRAEGLTLTRTGDAPSGEAALLQDLAIEASPDDYHYAALDVALQPATAYRLTVDEVTFTGGASDVLSVSLYDPATKTHLLRAELPVARYSVQACSWELLTPEGDPGAWKLLIYAGERGSTAGVGVACHGLMLVQAE